MIDRNQKPPAAAAASSRSSSLCGCFFLQGRRIRAANEIRSERSERLVYFSRAWFFCPCHTFFFAAGSRGTIGRKSTITRRNLEQEFAFIVFVSLRVLCFCLVVCVCVSSDLEHKCNDSQKMSFRSSRYQIVLWTPSSVKKDGNSESDSVCTLRFDEQNH